MKKILTAFLMLVFSVSFAEPYIAVASDGAKPASAVSETVGKAPYFIIFDEKGVYMESVPNRFRGTEGAGLAAVGMLKDSGVKVIIARSFPSERFTVFLKSKDMTGKPFKGSAEDGAKSVIKKK